MAQNISVGIIGSGVSGLYAALLLQSLDIPYEILEGNDRPGGRIWTHYFDPQTWKRSKPGQSEYYDYFVGLVYSVSMGVWADSIQDTGAMRIPDSPVMERLIGNKSNSLIRYINDNVSEDETVKLIPYVFSNDNTILYYNNVRRYRGDPATNDPFKTGLPAFAKQTPDAVWNSFVRGFLSRLSENFSQGVALVYGFKQSVREYLTSRKLSVLEIDWVETFVESTGYFDLDLSEVVLEDWFFGVDQSITWATVEGGMSRLIQAMASVLKEPIKYSQRVQAIKQTAADDRLTITTTKGDQSTYDHIINTVSLGAMQAIDMRALDMAYVKSLAIREIRCDDSLKVGIKFKTRWWQDLPKPIYGGQSSSDLPIRTCVYPSYGVHTTDAAAVLIASYTWGQDATRLGSYLHNPSSESYLIKLILSNLAVIHDISQSFLESQYISHYAYSWSNDGFALGAFPEFTPGQLQDLIPALRTPAAKGDRLHFGGDSVSVGHAWIVGALESAYRCVREVFVAEGRKDLVDKLEEKWGFETDPVLHTSTSPSRVRGANISSTSNVEFQR